MAIGAVLLARGVVVYGLGLIVLPLPTELPGHWLHMMFWASMRGAVSLAVVLSLPLNVPNRALLLDLTFGIDARLLVLRDSASTEVVPEPPAGAPTAPLP